MLFYFRECFLIINFINLFMHYKEIKAFIIISFLSFNSILQFCSELLQFTLNNDFSLFYSKILFFNKN